MPIFAVSFQKSVAGLTRLKLTKFPQNVAGSSAFNILKAELRSSNPFWNVSVPNKDGVANLAQKLVAMATSLKGSEKECYIYGRVHTTW